MCETTKRKQFEIQSIIDDSYGDELQMSRFSLDFVSLQVLQIHMKRQIQRQQEAKIQKRSLSKYTACPSLVCKNIQRVHN